MTQAAWRTLELPSLLHTANRWSGPALAARLGVSLRTLRRDIDTLRGPRLFEPHLLVLWAGRWYLVAYQLAALDWRSTASINCIHTPPPALRSPAVTSPGKASTTS